jgi:cysteine desulfurase
MRDPVYLDYHATTPVDPRVLEAMLPYFGPKFGNAASRAHRFGWEAEKAVEAARRRIAELAGAASREIIFTSGATESNNLALKGIEVSHIITMATEHRAVLDPARRAAPRLTLLQPQSDGMIDLAQLRAAIRAEPTLVSVMWANNEIGVIQPIAEIGAVCREAGAFFHCDAAQAFGKVPVTVEHVDLMSFSAHKLYGPKGVGALYVRRKKVRLEAQMDGGGHESGMRSGTLNVPGIVGFGQACSLAAREMAAEAARVGGLRDRMLARLRQELEGVRINGTLECRLPGNLNVSFDGVDAEMLLLSMPEIALSTGSACSSGTPEPRHVLRALGLPADRVKSSVRIGLGRFTTEEEVDYTVGRLVESVRRLRAVSPVL